MVQSRKPASLNPPADTCLIPARTCGTLGLLDQGDPNSTSLLGDTPGSLGWNDWASQDLPRWPGRFGGMGFCQSRDGVPLAPATSPLGAGVGSRKLASQWTLSAAANTLLKEVESLRLKPYDDQTGKDIVDWVKGATIGYGHLIKKAEWSTYKGGCNEADACTLLAKDLAPFVLTVQKSITAQVAQCEFDALVILTFNIGSGFATSSVAQLVNDPAAMTSYTDLASAWKAWNKSQGEVMKGLIKRRQCEWDIYSKAVYIRW